MKLKVIFTLIIVFFLSACSGLRINVGIDSICAFDNSPRDLLKKLDAKKEYILISAIKDIDKTDLHFNDQEVAFLINLVGGYPIFTQIGGYYMFDGKQQKLEGKEKKSLSGGS